MTNREAADDLRPISAS